MKKLFTLAIIVFAMTGCTGSSAMSEGELTEGRIKIVERTMIDGYPYFILSVDGEEFFTSGKGGIYPLKKSE